MQNEQKLRIKRHNGAWEIAHRKKHLPPKCEDRSSDSTAPMQNLGGHGDVFAIPGGKESLQSKVAAHIRKISELWVQVQSN